MIYMFPHLWAAVVGPMVAAITKIEPKVDRGVLRVYVVEGPDWLDEMQQMTTAILAKLHREGCWWVREIQWTRPAGGVA